MRISIENFGKLRDAVKDLEEENIKRELDETLKETKKILESEKNYYALLYIDEKEENRIVRRYVGNFLEDFEKTLEREGIEIRAKGYVPILGRFLVEKGGVVYFVESGKSYRLAIALAHYDGNKGIREIESEFYKKIKNALEKCVSKSSKNEETKKCRLEELFKVLTENACVYKDPKMAELQFNSL